MSSTFGGVIGAAGSDATSLADRQCRKKAFSSSSFFFAERLEWFQVERNVISSSVPRLFSKEMCRVLTGASWPIIGAVTIRAKNAVRIISSDFPR